MADQADVNIFLGLTVGGLTRKALKCRIFRLKRRCFPPEMRLRMSLCLLTPESQIVEGILPGLAICMMRLVTGVALRDGKYRIDCIEILFDK